MMPLWIYTVGQLIFTDGLIDVPFAKIATLAAGLFIPLGVIARLNFHNFSFQLHLI